MLDLDFFSYAPYSYLKLKNYNLKKKLAWSLTYLLYPTCNTSIHITRCTNKEDQTEHLRLVTTLYEVKQKVTIVDK